MTVWTRIIVNFKDLEDLDFRVVREKGFFKIIYDLAHSEEYYFLSRG